jgi:K+-sensing histidine kinase KdpD
MSYEFISSEDSESVVSGQTLSATIRYSAALLMTALAAVVAIGVDMQITIPNLSLIFVIPVIISAVSLGLGPSLLSAILGVAFYDFFLTAPRLSLAVDDPANIWALCLLFIVGLVASTVSFTSRRRAIEKAALENRLALLHAYSRDLAVTEDQAAIAVLASRTVAALFELPAAVVLLDGKETTIRTEGGLEPNNTEIEAARLSVLNNEVVHGGVYPNVASRFDFWPFRTRAGAGAVLGVAFDADDRPSAVDKFVAIVGNTLAVRLDRFDLHPPV